MNPKEFEGSSNPLDAEEWLSSIQLSMEFMELNDRERVFCASFMFKREARYWWDSIKARRDVNAMTWAEFVKEFNRIFFQSYRNECTTGGIFNTEARQYDCSSNV